jgi:hypothetical protein
VIVNSGASLATGAEGAVVSSVCAGRGRAGAALQQEGALSRLAVFWQEPTALCICAQQAWPRSLIPVQGNWAAALDTPTKTSRSESSTILSLSAIECVKHTIF